MRRIIIICVVVSIAFFISCSQLNPVQKSDNNFQGIDVSHHQGEINWSKVATVKNIKFVYIKATEGNTHKDTSYNDNIKGARDNGILVGSYHFLKSNYPIEEQFVNYKSVVDKSLQDLIPMVDVEEKIEKDSIRLFCKLIEEYYGMKPIIYGTNSSYNKFCAPDFNNFYLLIGRYGEKPPEIKGKGHYNIWQYSEKGKVNGISKLVDLDRFHPDFNISDILLR